MSNSKDKRENCSTCGGDTFCRLDLLTPLAQQINCLDPKVIADICIRQIPQLVNARLASIYILDDHTEILHLQKHNHPFLINNIVSLNQQPPSPMVMAVRSKQLMHVQDIDAFNKPPIKPSQRQFSQNYRTKSCVIAPLICQGQVVGVLNMADKLDGGPFSPEDIAIIELIRQLVGASIGNIKLFEKTQRQARTDGLTGLINHRTFYDILEREQRRSQRYGGHISLIMADIDNLKPINDNYGHRAGDLAIRQAGRKICDCIREIDVAARYGGDEFAVILPNTSLADATVVAQRMVDDLHNSPITWENEQIPLSISIGVGQYDATCSPEEIARSVDEALYHAKQNGKGRVHVYELNTTK